MKLVRALLALAYPFLVFGGLEVLEPRLVALLVGFVLLTRAVARWRRPSPEELRRLRVPALLVVATLAPTLLWNDARFLLFAPALIGTGLLLAFGRTLFGGPTLVETFARMQDGDLSPEEVEYCRSVTLVWCAFFLANAALSLWLALAGDLWLWALYTGFLAYVAIGLIFAVEMVIRARRFGRYQGSLLEPLFRRLFPHGPRA